MTLLQLRFLVSIVDSGLNVTAAAERLHATQPGVSKQLKNLEEELGTPLFVRKGRSFEKLTATGERVVQHARSILREMAAVEQIGTEGHDQSEGHLHIATTHTQARYVLPAVIRDFRRKHPRVALHLHQGSSEQLSELMASRRADLVIASSTTEYLNSLVRLPCYRWDRVIIVPKSHELALRSEPLTLEVLARHPLISYTFSFQSDSSLVQAFSARGLSPNVVVTARDADVIKEYVRQGLGLGIIASMAFSESDCSELTALDASGLFPPCTTWLGLRPGERIAQYALDFVTEFAPHIDEGTLEDLLQSTSPVRTDPPGVLPHLTAERRTPLHQTIKEPSPVRAVHP